jgi:putative addiction module component (TIGR02574 family)
MAASMKSLGIDQWSPTERLRLMDEIWESLQEVPTDILTPAQLEELQRCIEEDDNDPNGGTEWTVVMQELLTELDDHAADHHIQSKEAHS